MFEKAVTAAEQKLGLTGQPRAIVFHEKLGRRHAHCVWSRIDADQMKAIKLSHYKRKLMDVSRELYRTHEWDMPDGFRDHDARDQQNYRRQEAGQAARAKADPKKLKAMFQSCWDQSDTAMASSDLIRLCESNDVTTKDYLAAEHQLGTCAESLSKTKGTPVGAAHISHAIREQDAAMRKSFGGRLSDEQRAALHHILGPERLACIVGLAGAGKSTMLKTARTAWEKQGIAVHGAALAGKAAEGLQSASGISIPAFQQCCQLL
ncbi:hypothetical protein NBRC116598_24400 [Pseudophaeobacter arcticus]|uniref:MobA/VirD2-like nuclease domain-containing protein n=1 Tax=Pseudophaeobacter arcticus TaxID=385492 RepID=A0ABQ0AM96_9RHOB